MACEACESSLGYEHATLLPWHGTRISVAACERHTTEISAAFDLLNAFYESSYKEAVSELTSTLLALHRKETD
jgi:hypothetical protein